MSWSPKQLEAIETRGKNILVAAAAGSGKTSVLVERIIQRILDKKDPMDVDRILVVTFTNAAAAEMRSRVGAALTEALNHSPKDQHLERQLVLLHSASICTLHAFCQSMVRQYFHLLELDPKFRIAGEGEQALLKNEVLEELFERKYNEGDPSFLQVVNHYGDEESDQPLHQLVLGLYGFSRSHPWPDRWLEDLTVPFRLAPKTSIEDTPWSALLRESLLLELEQARHTLEYLAEQAGFYGLEECYGSTLEEDRRQVEKLQQAADDCWSRLSDALTGFSFGKMASAPKGTDEEVKKFFRDERKKALDKIKAFQSRLFQRPAESFLEDLRQVAPLVAGLSELTIEFADAFAKAKRAKGLIDFNDLEHFCLQILRGQSQSPDMNCPSEAALALRDKYREIMVDEYQDTNGVQEAILQLVASEISPNRFMVGDVKQSIYRFRLAEPNLFLEKYRQYPQAADCVRIDLSQNFRSRAGVLDAVNFLFCQLMSPRASELEYGEAEQLNPGPDYPPLTGVSLDDPVEVCVIDRDENEEEGHSETEAGQEAKNSAGEEELSGFELEARFIARKITALMEENRQVFDKSTKGYRPLAWRDIVILLRSVKGKADVLMEMLRQEGIPVYADLDSGYFREIEVQILLAVLSVIDNPCQDIPLAAVMRSPIGGFAPVELAEIRLLNREATLWEAVQAASEQGEGALREKACTFAGQIQAWRDFSRRKGVPELIWQIYRDTGYYEYVGGMPGGLLRQANLRVLYDRARQYESTSFRGLFRFLRFVERMQEKGSDLAVARALGESEDVVRVMSIHKSKGLEFPVVFVADLGKAMNLQDSRALVLCHKDLGLGPYVTQPELRFRYPTLARMGISHKLIMEAKAEELRILYVALTRAREKLILVGSATKLQKKAEHWGRLAERPSVTLPDWLIAGAKSYLDWIFPALARHKDGGIIREYAGGEGSFNGPLCQHPSRWQLQILPAAALQKGENLSVQEAPFLENIKKLQPVEAGENMPWVAKTLGWQYGYQHVTSKPAKLSVTEIKRRFDIQDQTQGQRPFQKKSIFLRPTFIQEKQGLSGAETGVLMHSILQHLTLQENMEDGELTRQLEAMVLKEILLAEQARQIDKASILAFLASDLGRRMCRSPKVRRELPFSILLPAERFYPDMKETGEGIFVQGVIDVLFDEGDGLVLVDYKTDKVRSGEELAGRYRLQLELYAEAIETIYGRPVTEKYLYAFALGQSIAL